MLTVLCFMLKVFSVMRAVLSFMLMVSFFMLMVSFFMLMVSFFALRVLIFMRHCGKRSRWGVLVQNASSSLSVHFAFDERVVSFDGSSNAAWLGDRRGGGRPADRRASGCVSAGPAIPTK